MGMTLNYIWPHFCANIQSNQTTNIDQKIRAINSGCKYLLNRSIQLLSEDLIPKDYLTDAQNLSNDAASHRLALPDNFVKLFAVWRKISTTRYTRLLVGCIVPLDRLQQLCGDNFHDNTYYGTTEYVAVAEPYLYLDKYIEDEGTDNIKIQCYETPDDIVAYEKLVITDASGTFQAEEIITGNESNAIATIYEVGDGYLYLYSKDFDGTFITGETITGSSSLKTATAGALTNKPATLPLTAKYLNHVVESAGLQYHVERGSDEIAGRSETVDEMIYNIEALNQNRVQISWGLNDYV